MGLNVLVVLYFVILVYRVPWGASVLVEHTVSRRSRLIREQLARSTTFSWISRPHFNGVSSLKPVDDRGSHIHV